jgi:hypothetical protein
MSIEALNWAWEQPVAKAANKLVLLALADHANGDGECWPSMKRIADRSDISARHVSRAINELVDLGLVEKANRRRHGGQYRGWDYRLLIQQTPAASGHGRPVTSGHGRPSPADTGVRSEPSENRKEEPLAAAPPERLQQKDRRPVRNRRPSLRHLPRRHHPHRTRPTQQSRQRTPRSPSHTRTDPPQSQGIPHPIPQRHPHPNRPHQTLVLIRPARTETATPIRMGHLRATGVLLMETFWFYHEYLDEARRFRIHRVETTSNRKHAKCTVKPPHSNGSPTMSNRPCRHCSTAHLKATGPSSTRPPARRHLPDVRCTDRSTGLHSPATSRTEPQHR